MELNAKSQYRPSLDICFGWMCRDSQIHACDRVGGVYQGQQDGIHTPRDTAVDQGCLCPLALLAGNMELSMILLQDAVRQIPSRIAPEVLTQSRH